MANSRRTALIRWSPVRFLAAVLITVFLVEACMMFGLPVLLPADISDWAEALADASLLSVCSGPILWYAIVRPLRNTAIWERSRYESIIKHAADGIVTTDERGIILSFNPAAETLFGYTANEAIGNNVSMLVPSSYREVHDEHLRRNLAATKRTFLGMVREVVGLHKNGEILPLEISVSEVPGGSYRFFTAIARDISKRKEAERKLVEAKQAAEEAAHAKSNFLANMSHEIRTPMTAILGFSDELLNFNLSPDEMREVIHIIQRNGNHLLHVINDILDVSKFESGAFEVESTFFSPEEILRDVRDSLATKAQAKGLSVEVEVPGEIPITIQSDPTRLRQALLNLVGNAIKFTSEGNVRVIAECDRQEETLTLHVSDSGIGMTPRELENIFVPFGQADISTTRRFGGTGLGLTITKRIAEALGGDVIVMSEPEVGSTFSLTIGTGSLEGVEMTSGSPLSAAGH